MKIFIPCAGIGSRLEYLTKNINKSLVSIDNKPAISHIIEKFSKEHVFVIALGHKGELLRQFLELAYTDRKFDFVNIDNYDQEGSGLGYTLYQCKEQLQEPFLFISTDSLFDESQEYILENKNSIFFSDITDEEFQYRKLEIQNNKLSKITEKTTRGLVYTGVCHIDSYKEFWETLEPNKEFILTGESYVLNLLCKKIDIFCKKLTWHDMGNLKSLENIKKKFISKFNILDKENESIWFLDTKVIKYHDDKKFIANRVSRFKVLEGYVPKLIGYSTNMYCYDFINGDTLSHNFDLMDFKNLLIFLEDFWKIKKIHDYNQFQTKCLNFYRNKTYQRIELYKKINPNDCENINGICVGPLSALLTKINWHSLSSGIPVNFHGDLHFENIIKTPKNFCLIDWRQDFEQDVEAGDIYYDLAKLLHGMIIAHDIIKNNQYSIKYLDSNSVFFDFYLKNINLVAQEILFEYMIKKGYSIQRVKILTALIFLNIAPLHHEPYNHLLYYLGKLQLYYALMEK